MPNTLAYHALLIVMIAPIVLSGCSTLSPSSRTIIETNRSNITVSSTVSLRTQSLLMSAGHTRASCMADFDNCIDEVKAVFLDDNKSRLAILAELFFAYNLHLKEQPICKPTLNRPPIDPYYISAPKTAAEMLSLQQIQADCYAAYHASLYEALKHSYAYITYNSLTGKHTSSTIVNEEEIQAQDIYHMAINTLIADLYLKGAGKFQSITRHNITQTTLRASNPHGLNQVPISYFTTQDNKGHTDTIHVYIANHADYTANIQSESSHALAELTSIYDTRLPNLNVTSTRNGLGVGYIGSLHNRYRASLKSLQGHKNNSTTASRIYPMGHLLMTAVIIPTGDTLETVLDSHDYHAYFFNPYTDESVPILGKSYPLFANFSAGYAKWLYENQFQTVGITNLFNPSDAYLPELFMLEPYDRNKKVIIMMHGLASSPKTWLQLTNSLLADPVLRDNYQVWQVFYSTNLPILENRYHIQALLNTTFKATDPKNTHTSSHHAVIISHSMGAVIARLMLSSDNLLSKLTADTTSDNDQQQLSGYLAQDEVASRFMLSPLPQVDTAIFISAPFRGTDYADRWFSRTIRRTIRLPASLGQSLKLEDNSPLHSLYLQDGASQLSDKSAFIKLTQDVNISPAVRYHSIMADNTGNKDGLAVGEHISDGIVPYESSHLKQAISEMILDGNHRIHRNPKTILHLRHILHDTLANTPSQ